MRNNSLIVLLTTLILAFNVNAQNLNSDDSTFVVKALSGGMMEVNLGKIAQEKASVKSVKNFGKMMVTDHSKANNELKAFIKKSKVSIKTAMLKDEQNKVNDLIKVEKPKFDKEYMSAMVDDHKSDIKDFEDAAEKVQNTSLKAWINKTLPTLKKHLSAAQKVQEELKNMAK